MLMKVHKCAIGIKNSFSERIGGLLIAEDCFGYVGIGELVLSWLTLGKEF